MQIKQGDIVEGIITGITKYGAFADVGGVTGMIHISEISKSFVNDIAEHLKVNQEIKAVVIGLNGDRLALSLKRLPEAATPAAREDFEDMMNKFKRESDERIAELNLEVKRAPRGGKNKKNNITDKNGENGEN